MRWMNCVFQNNCIVAINCYLMSFPLPLSYTDIPWNNFDESEARDIWLLIHSEIIKA